MNWPALLFSAAVASAHTAGAAQPAEAPQVPAAKAAAPPTERVTGPDGLLDTRAVWPVGVPLFVRINPRQIMDAKPHRIELRADIPGAPAIEEYVESTGVISGLSGPDMPWTDRLFLAGTPREAREGVGFSLVIANSDGVDPGGPAKPSGPLKLPVSVKGAVDDVLKPVDLPDLDAALPNQLNALFYRRGWESKGQPRLWLGTYTNCEGAVNTAYPGICHILAKHPDVTFAVRAEVMYEGTVVAWSRAWWRGSGGSVNPFIGMLAVNVEEKELAKTKAKDGRWELRLMCDPETALRDFASSRYWKGDVKVPLRVTDSRNWSELTANHEDGATK